MGNHEGHWDSTCAEPLCLRTRAHNSLLCKDHLEQLSGVTPMLIASPPVSTRNPYYNILMQKLMEIHEKKNHDYASDEDPFSNFMHTAKALCREAGERWDSIDSFEKEKYIKMAYAALISTKEARLEELYFKAKQGDDPKNEPILKSEVDNVNYRLIRLAHLLKLAGIDTYEKLTEAIKE